jgi:hypothetical protein
LLDYYWWRAVVAACVLIAFGVKLSLVVISGETAHEDGGQVFCRVKADGFTRGFFAVLAVILFGIAALIILARFGHF